MNFIKLILLVILLATGISAKAQYGTLTIYVENITRAGGVLRLGIYTRSTGLFKDSYRWDSIDVKPNESYVFVVDSLPYQEYAIAVYQDLNNDNDLNNNFFGIPNEPYALSNISSVFSYPTFDKMKIVLDSTNKQLTLVLDEF